MSVFFNKCSEIFRCVNKMSLRQLINFMKTEMLPQLLTIKIIYGFEKKNNNVSTKSTISLYPFISLNEFFFFNKNCKVCIECYIRMYHISSVENYYCKPVFIFVEILNSIWMQITLKQILLCTALIQRKKLSS